MPKYNSNVLPFITEDEGYKFIPFKLTSTNIILTQKITLRQRAEEKVEF